MKVWPYIATLLAALAFWSPAKVWTTYDCQTKVWTPRISGYYPVRKPTDKF